MTTPIIPELLPCLKCGNFPTQRGYESGSMLYYTRCVGGYVGLVKRGNGHVFAAYGPTQEEADIAWNTRHPDQPTTNPHTLAMEEALEALKMAEGIRIKHTYLGQVSYEKPRIAEQLTTAIASLTKALGR